MPRSPARDGRTRAAAAVPIVFCTRREIYNIIILLLSARRTIINIVVVNGSLAPLRRRRIKIIKNIQIRYYNNVKYLNVATDKTL